MPGHTKKKRAKNSKGKKFRKRVVKKVKQIAANSRLRTTVASAADRKTRLARGQNIKKDFHPDSPIQKKPSPGVRARLKNLEVHGEATPVRTRGKIDKGGPLKRAGVAFQRLKNRATASATAKDVEADRRRHEKADFKNKITKIHKLKNDRFKREQEKKALARRRAALDKRKSR